MMQVLNGVFQNAPVWVWPLFVVLILIGLMASRARSSSIVPYCFLPLFGLLAMNSVWSLVHVPYSWVVFAAAYLISAWMFFRWQDGVILKKEGRQIELGGEWVTMIVIMVIFFSNFANGVFEAVLPELRQNLFFTVVFAGLIGGCSGSFLGRTIRVLSLKSR